MEKVTHHQFSRCLPDCRHTLLNYTPIFCSEHNDSATTGKVRRNRVIIDFKQFVNERFWHGIGGNFRRNKHLFSYFVPSYLEGDLSEIILSEFKYIPFEDISSCFSASDIVALPYLNIYQSGIFYLACAYLRPVIVTNVGGLPEVVEQNKKGFIAPQ